MKLLLLFALAGCGKVQALADASIDGKLPDALTCSGTQELCGNACADLQSSMTSCGACGIACQADRETCMAGHCIDFNTSCAAIKAGMPGAMTGPYTLLNNSTVYCDMEHSFQYTGIGFGQYNATHPGYDIVSPTDFNDPALQKIFIYWFNRQSGLVPVITQWVGTNCCMKASATAGQVLQLGGSAVFVTQPNTSTLACNPAAPGYTGNLGFELTTGPVPAVAPMPDNFFVAHPATEAAGCSDGNNPALFWHRTAF